MIYGQKIYQKEHPHAAKTTASWVPDLTELKVDGSITFTFSDWFNNCFLPHASQLKVRVAFWGDSLYAFL